MPGDLSNPEMSIPYHYDPKYEPGTNTFESRPLSIEQIINTSSRSLRGCPMTRDEMLKAKEFLNGKSLLNRNPGDQEVQEIVNDFIKNLCASKKILKKYSRLICQI